MLDMTAGGELMQEFCSANSLVTERWGKAKTQTQTTTATATGPVVSLLEEASEYGYEETVARLITSGE